MEPPSSRTSSTSSPATPATTASTPLSTRPSTDGSPYAFTSSTSRPYLPLRKASSEALRNGHMTRRTPERQHHNYVLDRGIPEETAIEKAQHSPSKTQPSTTYTSSPRLRQPRQDGLQPPFQPQPKTRARSFSEEPSQSSHTIRQPILRAATSIPDYKAIRNAYKQTAESLPPSPQFDRTVSAGHSLHSTRSPSFWRNGGADSLRTSIRSAMSNRSSTTQQEWSETERSSVWTNASTASEMLPSNPHWPLIKEEEMSVEDAINMYADDSAEDNEDGKSRTQQSSSPSTVNRISNHVPPPSISRVPPGVLSLPFANGKPNSGSMSLPTAQVQASSHVAAGHIDHTTPVKDRLRALVSVPRDRYGFKKQSKDITVVQYDAWNATYTKYLERRRKKWIALMKNHNLPTDNPTRFPPRSDKVKRYIRKGIPPEWRGNAWFWYAGGPAILSKQAGVYDILLKRAETGHLSEGDREHIERDLHRTYPDNIHFKPDIPPTPSPTRPPTAVEPSLSSSNPPSTTQDISADVPMITSLRNVLQAFAIANPKTGYCQSLNFLAAHLLLFLHGNEEKAFHLLSILCSHHLPGTHSLSLEGANIDIGVLMLLLRETMPALWNKLDDRADATVALAAGDMRVSTGLPTVSLATTAWFMSCYAASLPVETTCRVWDALFYEGSKTLFRIGLAIFRMAEPEVMKLAAVAAKRGSGKRGAGGGAMEPMEAFQVVQMLPRTLLDANAVMEIATGKRKGAFAGMGIGGKEGFGGISQKLVERRREERRGLYKAEKERVLKPLDRREGEEVIGNGGVSESRGDKLVKKMPSRVRLNRLKSLRSPSKIS
jgi:hypothetical protein